MKNFPITTRGRRALLIAALAFIVALPSAFALQPLIEPILEPPPADMSVTLSGPAETPRGQPVQAKINIQNLGPKPAPKSLVHIRLPEGQNLRLVASASAVCQQYGRSDVYCIFESIGPNEGRAGPLTFSVPSGIACGSKLVFVAEVLTTAGDFNETNNWSKWMTKITCEPPSVGADLVLKKSGPVSVIRGNNVTYQLGVRNAGPETARNVNVMDTLPVGMKFIASESDPACLLTSKDTVSCQVGSMPASQGKDVKVTVGTLGVDCGTTVTNMARVESATPDPNTGNNKSKLQTTVTCEPQPGTDLAIYKKGPRSAQPGGNIVYDLWIGNEGDSPAQKVLVTDEAPKGVTFDSVAAPIDVKCMMKDSSMLRCTIPLLEKGEKKRITITGTVSKRITECTVLTNTAKVDASVSDADPVDNVSSVKTLVLCKNEPEPRPLLNMPKAEADVGISFRLRNE